MITQMAHERPIVVVKGAGEAGTGVAHRLWLGGFRVLCTDLPRPTTIRRSVAFATAIYDGRATIDGIQAERISQADEAYYLWSRETLPVMADAAGRIVGLLHPEVVIDAILAGRNTGTQRNDAACVIALGPGFEAGLDCHAVLAYAEPDSGHIVHAPTAGIIRGRRAIGDAVRPGDAIASIGTTPVIASVNGVLRGLIHDGLPVDAGGRVADIDPRGEPKHCFTQSEQALAIGVSVMEAVRALRGTVP